MVDLRDEFFDRVERAAADRLIGDRGEESLNEIEPGTIGWCEMHMPTRSVRQPRLDLGVLVRGIVVHDHVDVQIGGDGLVNAAQERQKFLMPMSGFAFGQYRPVKQIERSKESRCAMADIIVRHAFRIANQTPSAASVASAPAPDTGSSRRHTAPRCYPAA